MYFLITLLLAGVFLLYGTAKIAGWQFHPIETDKRVHELKPIQLMWYFFGYSPIYAKFIGTTQVIVALLLFPKKTRTISLLIYFIITINILVLNIAFKITAQTFTMSCILAFLCLMLLIRDRNRIKALLN